MRTCLSSNPRTDQKKERKKKLTKCKIVKQLNERVTKQVIQMATVRSSSWRLRGRV
jgi:hypothetical protein